MLALLFLKTGARKPVLNLAHGLAGAAGLGALVWALQGPRRGDAMGTGAFGTVAAVLFALAVTIGVCLPGLHRRSPRMMGAALALHAGLAISGFVLFLAWTAIGE